MNLSTALRGASMVLLLATACILASAAHSKTTDESDLWWDPTESGWGIQIVQQNNTIFATMFVYGPDGQPTWYSATLLYQGTNTFTWSGALYKTTGPWFGTAPFDPAAVTRTPVGTMTFASVTDLRMGTLTYTVAGVQIVKQIQRQLLVYENFNGTYSGVMSQSGTGATCNVSANTNATPATVQINQNTTAMTIVTQSAGNTCTFPGAYSQAGHFGELVGNYVCTNGDSGNFLIFEMAVSSYDIRARTRLIGQTGCTIKGYIVGLIQPPPTQ